MTAQEILSPRMQRVLVEREDVIAKIATLDHYIRSDEFKAASRDEQTRVGQQRRVMGEYADLLGLRIRAEAYEKLSPSIPAAPPGLQGQNTR